MNVDMLEAEIPLEPCDPASVVSGSPAEGYVAIGAIGDRELGVWEITPGTVTAVESAEAFVVLRGEATVSFVDDRPSLDLRPGVAADLADGERTVWTVHETLRKAVVS